MLKYHIQTIEVGSGGASAVTFSSIPAIYTDLMIVCSTRATVDQRSLRLRLNGSTSNFSARYLQGNGSVINNFTDTSVQGLTSSSTETANNFSNSSFYIANYLSNTPKAISVDAVIENNGTQAFQRIGAGLWSSTEAIAIVQISPDSGDFAQYSSFSLYGIRRGSDGRTEVASGGTITTSGLYTYHSFTSSGTFVANRDLQIEALVVAGGGGGGRVVNGGGGAGGLLYNTTNVSRGQSYSVVIGSGGAGATGGYDNGAQGNSSTFLPVGIAIYGGAGGGWFETNDRSGGSGGGGGYGNTGTAQAAGGAGTPGQGNNGGNTYYPVSNTDYTGAGGGGGAGGAGGDGSANGGGAGGVGTSSYSTWGAAVGLGENVAGTYYFAGGGGGGASGLGFTSSSKGVGGVGGGGSGGVTNKTTGTDLLAATAGLANTGGGGGGACNDYSGNNSTTQGKNGGSGVVIIRYLTPA